MILIGLQSRQALGMTDERKKGQNDSTYHETKENIKCTFCLILDENII